MLDREWPAGHMRKGRNHGRPRRGEPGQGAENDGLQFYQHRRHDNVEAGGVVNLARQLRHQFKASRRFAHTYERDLQVARLFGLGEQRKGLVS